MFKKIVLASHNVRKAQELSIILKEVDIEVIPQSALNIDEAPEPYATFVENALSKARHAAKLSGLPALADDSGLCVDALGGSPGVLSARFAGEPRSDERNNTHLLLKLQGIQARQAHYYCVLVLIRHAEDPEPIICDGYWQGEIIDTPKGRNGFGYDPIFYIPELEQTVAQIDSVLKNSISHRALAMQSLMQRLNYISQRN